MAGINSIFNVGTGALYSSQSAIQTTSENISNVNTEGYTRRKVRFEEGMGIDYNPGQIGTGVRAAEVYRHFDRFIENSYNDKASTRERWDSLNKSLSSVESLFNESKGYGLNSTLTKFFENWQSLTQRPNDASTRQQLLSTSRNLVNTIHGLRRDLVKTQLQTEDYIRQDVTKANKIMKQIADINKRINVHQIDGQNNPNNLYDQRDKLVRDLSKIMDTNIIDKGKGDFSITTKAGQTLVDGQKAFSLSYEGPRSQNNLTPESNFEGKAYFEGSSDFEYTLEAVTNGKGAASGAGAAQFRVSLDGGKTWMKDENGKDKLFYARGDDNSIQVDDLRIWFGSAKDSQAPSSGDMSKGDRFVISPKSSLYWVKNTSTKENITPEINFAGVDNSRRLTGGTLTGHLTFRDYHVGKYKERMDALSKELAWQVNRIHSQGSGLQAHTQVNGTYSVTKDDTALGSGSSGLAYFDKLQKGNATMYFYDATTGNPVLVSGATGPAAVASGPIDFDPTTPEIDNFDPEKHSLTDVQNAINGTYGQYVSAEIVNHKLRLTAKEGYTMQFGTDTAGLYAGLGINTYFGGSQAHDISLNAQVNSDSNFVNAGHVNGSGEANAGDNNIATRISALTQKDISINTAFDGTSSQTLIEYYDQTVSSVGSDKAAAKFNYNFNKTLASDLNDRQQSVSGVNIDEEMTNLMKYQHSYTAAAKVIKAADQLLQTVLSLKN